MLKTRLLTAFVLLGLLAIILLVLPAWVWPYSLALVVWFGAGEWAALAGFGRAAGWVYRIVLTAAGFLLLPGVILPDAFPVYVLSVLLWLLLVPWWLIGARHVRHPVLLAFTGWVLLVPTWLALVDLHAAGLGIMLAALGVVWLSDTAAYFAGRRFGKHKLAPSISPGKTWEGVAGAMVVVSLYAWWLMSSGALGVAALIPHGMLVALPLAWALAALGIVGDLFESWLKRCAGVKDSGTILPGHGGILDRVDALTAVLPLAAMALLL